MDRTRVGAMALLGPATSREFDVVIVGAGIIGLGIANRFLKTTELSVAVVEAAPRLCAGATGAGQGYLWSGHHDPAGPKWPFVRRSSQLWHEFAAEVKHSGLDPLSELGWRETGSLLVTTTSEQSMVLHHRLHELAASGLQVEYWDSAAVQRIEPALRLPGGGAAGLVHGDVQIDAALTVRFIQETNRSLGISGRYEEFFNNPVVDLIWSPSDNAMRGLQTPEGCIHSKKAIIIAAGAWTARLMEILSERYNVAVVPPIKPRKGHLLVLHGIPNLHLNHGLMELEYLVTKHSVDQDTASSCGIAMTATMDTSGNLLVGSSRQFKGFDTEPEDTVIQQIVENTARFLPALSSISVAGVVSRIGLRPYITGGKPVIGPVEEFPGLYLASGHEGEGLSLAWATAEMLVDMVSKA